MITAKPPAEAVVHRQVCDYLRMKYPHAIFNSDGAGQHQTKTQAGMAKMLRSHSGYPDLFIAEPYGKYHGLFLELKRDGARVFLRDGSLSTDPHIVKQEAMLDALQRRGYAADFAIGYEEACTKIDWYFNQ